MVRCEASKFAIIKQHAKHPGASNSSILGTDVWTDVQTRESIGLRNNILLDSPNGIKDSFYSYLTSKTTNFIILLFSGDYILIPSNLLIRKVYFLLQYIY